MERTLSREEDLTKRARLRMVGDTNSLKTSELHAATASMMAQPHKLITSTSRIRQIRVERDTDGPTVSKAPDIGGPMWTWINTTRESDQHQVTVVGG